MFRKQAISVFSSRLSGHQAGPCSGHFEQSELFRPCQHDYRSTGFADVDDDAAEEEELIWTKISSSVDPGVAIWDIPYNKQEEKQSNLERIVII